MSEQLVAAEDRLIESLAAAARGPQRNGTYALWLFVRTCSGLLPPDRLSEPGQMSKLEGLQRRLRHMALPPPLRRALAGSMRELGAGTPSAAAIALQQLVAPAKECVGGEAGEALALAARSAREANRDTRT